MAGQDCVIALYEYSAMQEDELSFKEGQVLVVIERDNAGWWRGNHVDDSKSGWFPANYVEPYKG